MLKIMFQGGGVLCTDNDLVQACMKGLTSLFVQYSDRVKRDGNTAISVSKDKNLDAIAEREREKEEKDKTKSKSKSNDKSKGGKGKDNGNGNGKGKEEQLQTYFSEAAKSTFPLSESNMRSLLQVRMGLCRSLRLLFKGLFLYTVDI